MSREIEVAYPNSCSGTLSRHPDAIPDYWALAQYLGVDHVSTIYSLVSKEPLLRLARRYIEAQDSKHPIVYFDKPTVDKYLEERKKMTALTKGEISHLFVRALELLRELHLKLYHRPLDLLEAGLVGADRVKAPPQSEGRTDKIHTCPLSMAAKTLGMSVSNVRWLADKGTLRHTRSPGGHRRVFVKDVLAERDRRRTELQLHKSREAKNGSDFGF